MSLSPTYDEGKEFLTSSVYKPPTSFTSTTSDDTTTTIHTPPRNSEEYINNMETGATSLTPTDEPEELLPAAAFTPFSMTTPSTAETTPTTSTMTATTYASMMGKRSDDGYGSAPASGVGSGNAASPRSPRTPTSIITAWTAEECAEFLASLGFGMYCEAFLGLLPSFRSFLFPLCQSRTSVVSVGIANIMGTADNEIVGEALVALNHEELRELGVASAGHRLTILKRVYEIKRKHGVSFYKGHYVPITAEEDHDPVTKTEMSHLVQSIRQRDVRIRSVEIELRKLADDYRRMREEFLPVVKMAKDRSQPLPFQPAGSGNGNGNSSSTLTPDYNSGINTESASTLAPEKPIGSSLSRTLSKKLFPSKHSPTHAPSLGHDRIATPVPPAAGVHDHPTLDGLNTAFSSNGHLPSTLPNYNSHPSPKMNMNTSLNGNQPSPTSPNFFNASRARTPHGEYPNEQPKDRLNSPSSHKTPPTTTVTPATTSSGSGGLHYAPSVRRGPGLSAMGSSSGVSSHHHHDIPGIEATKSFRVTMDDPCYKVLPAALKKYNINEDWRLYALYIVCGEHERCLELDEKPLILFKQLDKEGRKPVFMLRRQAQGGPVGNTAKLGAGAAGNNNGSGGGSLGSGGHS
ncbi:Adaptor for signal transduction, partial [Ascosphaera aggregata]